MGNRELLQAGCSVPLTQGSWAVSYQPKTSPGNVKRGTSISFNDTRKTGDAFDV